MSALVEAALGYAERGWPVFPCEPGAKAPLGRLVPRGVKDATTDVARVRAWWGREPEANVGIATGAPAVDVLDVDVKTHGSGFAAFNRVKSAGLLTGASSLVSTPSGGVHVYFAGTGQRCGALAKHFLDFKASGGYVLAPPSVVDERDAKARVDESRRGVYELLDERDVTPVELEWAAVKRLLTPPAPRQPVRVRDTRSGVPPWLSERLRTVDVADRSAYFHGTVAACRRAGLSQHQTTSLLTSWCVAVDKYAGRVAAEVARSWRKFEG